VARTRAHHRLSLVLVVVASVFAFLSLFALWANRQFLNTDNWTESSSQLLENKEIRCTTTST
jgi:nitrate reductase gamma subunit